MAIVVIGGLISSTLLTVFLLPSAIRLVFWKDRSEEQHCGRFERGGCLIPESMSHLLPIRMERAILAALLVMALVSLWIFRSDLLRWIENNQNWLD